MEIYRAKYTFHYRIADSTHIQHGFGGVNKIVWLREFGDGEVAVQGEGKFIKRMMKWLRHFSGQLRTRCASQ